MSSLLPLTALNGPEQGFLGGVPWPGSGMLPCGFPFQAQTTLTTNDIVISKLTQILSYLRQGTRNKKLKKKDKGRK